MSVKEVQRRRRRRRSSFLAKNAMCREMAGDHMYTDYRVKLSMTWKLNVYRNTL